MSHTGCPRAPAQCAAIVSTVTSRSVAATAAANSSSGISSAVASITPRYSAASRRPAAPPYRLARLQQAVALGGAARSDRQDGPVRFIDPCLRQRKAGRIVVQAQGRQRQIVSQLRRTRQQFHGTPAVLLSRLPLPARVANNGEHAMGIGAAAILCKSQLGNRPRQIQPADFEQLARRIGQNFGRDRGHSGGATR
jgi:hypothetical protein